MADIFGRTISDDMVEDAVRASLQKWMDTEMRIIEQSLGLEARYYERPRSWEIFNDIDRFPEDQLPTVLIVSVGHENPPAKDGGKKYRAYFTIGVATIASSVDAESSRRYAYRMGAAVRAAMVHRQSLDGALDGTVRGVDWVGGSNRELPTEDARTIWCTRQAFVVEVGDVVTQSAGPSQPDDPPPPIDQPLPGWPTIPDRAHIHVSEEVLT